MGKQADESAGPAAPVRILSGTEYARERAMPATLRDAFFSHIAPAWRRNLESPGAINHTWPEWEAILVAFVKG